MASVRALATRPPSHAAALADTTPALALRRPPRSPLPHDARGNGWACFAELRTALEEGWEIVQPVFARPLWSVSDNSTTAFNFVLRRERATRLVTVPEGRSVQRFIRDHHLAVDHRQ